MITIDGREYDSHYEWLVDSQGTDPEAYRFPVLVQTTATYVVWVDGLDLNEARPGESGEQLAARVLGDDPEAWELLDGKTAVDGGWSVEPMYDEADYPNCWGASSSLEHWHFGPKLADGNFESEHARRLTKDWLDAAREANAGPARRKTVRTVQLPTADVAS